MNLMELDLTIHPDQIEKVVSSPSSANGSFRDVWYFGDIVIKRDKNPLTSWGCKREYERSQQLCDTTFEFEDETWSLRFPRTAMIGEYLIMERIHFPDASAEHCTDCTPRKERSEFDENDVYYYDHTGQNCYLDNLTSAVIKACSFVAVYDMHETNFKFDRATRTIWVIDFAG